ncbi:MAG TPA: ABC transporter ATP-binding protein [Caldilineaceae bacterium]|nr:ABC transporter ATP-binding protein [Caldilineaceae bacterium]
MRRDVTAPALALEGVTIAYRQGNQWLEAVREVSLAIAPGQTYGLVGESGSGKSTLALAVLRQLPANGAVRGGRMFLQGEDLLALDGPALRRVWAQQMKLVPQNALSALNPSLRIGDQLAEGLALSNGAGGTSVAELLRMVRIADPARVAASYPHQLSGGMQQRVMIALALSAEPALLVLDEPTTALDVTTEAAILDLIGDLIQARRTAVLFVSHNLGVVARVCDRVAVLYAGELVEDAPVDDLFRRPLHPYTQGLLASVPRLGQHKNRRPLTPILGGIPHLGETPAGCVFAPRCPLALERCHIERPTLDEPAPGRHVRCHRWPEILAGEIEARTAEGGVPMQPAPSAAGLIPSAATPARPTLAVQGLAKHFPLPRSLGRLLRGEPPRQVRAVDGVDLTIDPGRTLGLVGESGSGKTTVARCVIGLEEATSGQLWLLDIPLARKLEARDRAVLHEIQMVFQNPDEALNPYLTVAETLRRPLRRLARRPRQEVDNLVYRLLEMVRLRPEYASRLPAQLSGGEKQRVAIARAFAAQPDLLLFDESVSALDVSVQATILNLLTELQRAQGSAYLFISHDLGVVSYLADEVAVIYLGRLMEVVRSADLLTPPYHPYTEALLSAIPIPLPKVERPRIRLDGEVPSPTEELTGCPFHTRCPRCLGEICITQEPPWRAGANGQRIYCHIPLDDLVAVQQPVAVELDGPDGAVEYTPAQEAS